MNPQDRFLCLMALIGFGAFGWGDALVRATTHLFGGGPEAARHEEDLGAAMKIAIGIAVFLAVGGIAVAGRVAYFPELLGWQIAGCVLGLISVVRHHREGRDPTRRSSKIGLLLVSAIVGLGALGAALTGPFNANDDAPAYLYLAQRLLATGGMIDPFNTRRINSYGGAELFQALVLHLTGNAAGLGVEWFFFAMLLVLLVARAVRRPYLVLIALVLGIGIVTVRPVGLWTNVAPTFSGAALTVALMQLVRGARRGRAEPWRFVLGGVLLAGILSLRLEFFIPPALVLFLTPLVVVRGRRALVAMASSAVAFALALSGWAVALQASSGTPLFPVFVGNWSSASQWRNPAIHTISGYLSRFRIGLNQDHFDFVVLGTVLVAAVVVAAGARLKLFAGEQRSRLVVSCVVLVVGALGCCASLVFESFSLSGAVPTDIGRYLAPSTLACLAFCLDIVIEAMAASPLRAAPLPSPQPAALPASSPSAATVTPRRLGLWYRVGIGAAGLALFLSVLGEPLSFYGPAFKTELTSGLHEVTGQDKLADHFRTARAHYKKMNAMIPKGAYVLAAVEYPGLLSFQRYRFTTLDVVGGSSPPPHLPVFAGAAAVVRYLRGLGIDGIVATPPRAEGLYNLSAAEANLGSSIYNYQDSARYVVAWAAVLRQLGKEFHSGIRLVASLEYIPIGAPPGG